MAKKTTDGGIIDLRKTGPLGYKALQLANQKGYEVPEDLKEYLNYHTDYSYTQEYDTTMDAIADKQYSPEELGVGEDIGTSVWDPTSYNRDALENYQDIRAENQPGYVQALNGVLKGVSLAGTTFIDGTIGLLWGVGTAIAEGRISGIWDNAVTQAMASWNDAMEEALPNYYTSYQQNGPWYDPSNLFSMNTIFDKFVKNLGFVIGAAYSGGVYTKGLSLAARGIGSAKAAASALKAGTTATKEAIEAGARAFDMAKGTRFTKSVVGSVMAANAEGTVEAVNNSNEWVKSQKQEYEALTNQKIQEAYDKYLLNKGKKMVATGEDGSKFEDQAYLDYQKEVSELLKAKEAAFAQIDKDRTKMGNADLLMNLPILSLGNLLTFGKMYAGGWQAARNQGKTVTRATRQAMQDAKAAVKNGDKDAVKRLKDIVQRAKDTGYQGLSAEEKALVEEVTSKGFEFTSPLRSAARLIGPKSEAGYVLSRQMLKEGNEEMLQAAAARASASYYADDVDNVYSASINPDSEQKVLSWVNSIGQGLKDTYGDINNYEEGFIGALTGALGSPTFGKSNNSTDQTYLGKGKRVGLSGGVVAEWQNLKRDRAEQARIVEHVNRTLHDPNFTNRYRHLVAQTTFNNIKNEAIIHDDKKSFKDAETASIFEDVMYFKRAGKLDMLQKALENTQLFSEEDIQQIIESTTSQRSAVNPTINEDTRQRDALTTRLEQLQEEYNQTYGDDATNAVLKQAQPIWDNGGAKLFEEFQQKKREKEQELNSVEARLSFIEKRVNNSSSLEFSPYKKSDGTWMSDDEIKQDITERVTNIHRIINEISKAQDEIDVASGETYTDEQLTTLTWYKVMMRDWANRAQDISEGLKEFVNLASTDPRVQDVIDTYQYATEHPEDFGITSEQAKVLFGGTLSGVRSYQSMAAWAQKALQDVLEGKEGAGIMLAQILAQDKVQELKDSEGKPILDEEGNPIKQNLGEILKNTLLDLVEADNMRSSDQKVPIKQAIEDLSEIGKGYKQYNKLLEEYRNKPEKIEEVHRKIEERNNVVISNRNAKTIADRIDWDSSVGNVAKLLTNNIDDINNMGGMDKFIQALPKEYQEKVKNAQKLMGAIDGVHDSIDESTLEDSIKRMAHSLVDTATQDIENFDQAVEAIQELLDTGYVEANLQSLVPEDVDDLTKDSVIGNTEQVLQDFFGTALLNAAKAMDTIERHNQEKEKSITEAASATTETEQNLEVPSEPELQQEPQQSSIPEEKSSEEESSEEESSNDEYQKNQQTTKTAWNKWQENKDTLPIPTEGQRGKERRRALTEFYLHGKDSYSYVQYIKEHPDKIPLGVDRDAYIKYIETVTKYLKEKGAYNYISKQLQKEDEITFFEDEELSKAAGVPVVLMAVESRIEKDESGKPKMQVIGSLKTSMEFNIYDGAVKNNSHNKNLAIEAQRELYNKVLNNKSTVVKRPKSKTNKGATKIVSKSGTHGITPLEVEATPIAPTDLKKGDVIAVPGSNLGTYETFTFQGLLPDGNINLEEGFILSPEYFKHITGTAAIPEIYRVPKKELSAKEKQHRANSTQPDTIERRIIIDITSDGAHQIFGTTPEAEQGKYYTNAEKAVKFWKSRHGDPRTLVNPATGNTRENFYTEDESGISTITVFSNKNHTSYGRNDGAAIHFWRKLLPAEVKLIQDYLWNVEDSVSWEDIAKHIDSILHNLSEEQEEIEEEIIPAEPIKTKVSELLAGELPISSNENSVSSIFDTHIPKIGICLNGQITSGQKNVDSNIIQSMSAVDGQVYVLVPANNGKYIPALCYATPIQNLTNDSWYMQQTLSVLKDCIDPSNIKDATAELRKWLPLPDFHINLVQQMSGGKYVENYTGSATHLKLTYYNSNKTNKDGSEGGKETRYLNIKDGISDGKALLFIKNAAQSTNLTTNINKNRLADTEYIKSVSQYLYTNLVAGEFGQHTKDDWFLYEATEEEQKYLEKNKELSSTPTTNTTQDGLAMPTQSITYKGITYLVSQEGYVALENGLPVTSQVATEVREALKKEEADKAATLLKAKEEEDQRKAEEYNKKIAQTESEWGEAGFKVGDIVSWQSYNGKITGEIHHFLNDGEAVIWGDKDEDGLTTVFTMYTPRGLTLISRKEQTPTDTSNIAQSKNNTSSENSIREGLAQYKRRGSNPKKRNKPRTGANNMEVTAALEKEEIATEKLLQETVEKVKQLFPHLASRGRIIVVNGIINSINEKGDPVKAFGMFKDGVLYLSDRAPKGVAFHEAFHYVTDFLLNSTEKTRMFEVAREQYGELELLALEERLAEDFRHYMNGFKNPSLRQRIKMFFKNLANVLFGIKNDTQYLDTLFYNIANNRLSNRSENIVQDTFTEDLNKYKSKKLAYTNLNKEVKDYLGAREITQELYDKLNIEQKEILLHCM